MNQEGDRFTSTFNPTSSTIWDPSILNNGTTSIPPSLQENESKRRKTQQSRPSELPFMIPQTPQQHNSPVWSPANKNGLLASGINSPSPTMNDTHHLETTSTSAVPQWYPHQLIRSQSMTGLRSLAATPTHTETRQVQSRDQSPMRSMVELTLEETPSTANHQQYQQQPSNQLQLGYSTLHRPYPRSPFNVQQHNNSPYQNQPTFHRPSSLSSQFGRPYNTNEFNSASSSPSSSSTSPTYRQHHQESTSRVTQVSAVEHLSPGQQVGPLSDNDNSKTSTIENGSTQADNDDDDDDLIIDEEMTNRNICLGMIKSDVVTKDPLLLVKDDLFEPVLMQLEGLRQNNYSFTISSKKDPRKFYGWAPFDDTRILGPIAERHLVWWDTVIPRSKANLTRTPLYIILYCRSNVYHILCRYLSSQKTDLQDPPFFNPACRYSNPKFSKQPNQLTTTSTLPQNTATLDGFGSSYRNLPFSTASPTTSTPSADSANAYSEQTRRGIAQLLDNIPASSRRPNSATSLGDTLEPGADTDQLKQHGLTEEDLHMEGLTITLLPHQVEGIRWMKDREENEYSSGGILADMGLGKTIQTIGLVSSTLDATNKRQKTLIVAPLALIQQWASEFETKTTPGSIKLLIHHGGDRAKDSKDFDDYDVVVTTYQIVASDLASTSSTGKKRGRRRQKQQPAIGEDGLTPTETTDVDMGNGIGVFESDTSTASSRVASPNGNGQSQEDDARSDVAQNDGPLFQVSWHRVVLDEAQQIKNHVTRSSTACSKLVANKRWCLTGTPIQNRVEELYSLLRFLRIPSFSDMATFRRTISGPMQTGKVDVALERLKALLMAIMLRRTKHILSAPSGGVTPAGAAAPVSSSTLSSTTTTPTTSGFSTPTESSSNTLALGLPPREKQDVVLEFTQNERALYDVLTKKTSAAVEKLVRTGKSTRNYMNMICLVLRLRQACNHPQLVLRSLSNDEDILALASENSLAQQAAKRESSEAAMQRMVMAQMAADLGWSGVGQVGQSVFDKSSSKQSCELCGRPVILLNSEDNNSNVPPYCVNCTNQIKRYATMISPTSVATATSSTKINKMLDILQHTRQHYPDDKTIIFSQFTSMLDLMEEPLQEHGFKFCRYDGSMPNHAREKSLQVLRTDPDCRVMLISLKCGSLGLNLTAANRVILMDVWWNPAVEDQAIDRVHRIGQKLPVHVTRLLIDRTVEQKIIKLQQHKARIAKGALGDHMTSNSNLTTQELLSFFDL